MPRAVDPWLIGELMTCFQSGWNLAFGLRYTGMWGDFHIRFVIERCEQECVWKRLWKWKIFFQDAWGPTTDRTLLGKCPKMRILDSLQLSEFLALLTTLCGVHGVNVHVFCNQHGNARALCRNIRKPWRRGIASTDPSQATVEESSEAFILELKYWGLFILMILPDWLRYATTEELTRTWSHRRGQANVLVKRHMFKKGMFWKFLCIVLPERCRVPGDLKRPLGTWQSPLMLGMPWKHRKGHIHIFLKAQNFTFDLVIYLHLD